MATWPKRPCLNCLHKKARRAPSGDQEMSPPRSLSENNPISRCSSVSTSISLVAGSSNPGGTVPTTSRVNRNRLFGAQLTSSAANGISFNSFVHGLTSIRKRTGLGNNPTVAMTANRFPSGLHWASIAQRGSPFPPGLSVPRSSSFITPPFVSIKRKCSQLYTTCHFPSGETAVSYFQPQPREGGAGGAYRAKFILISLPGRGNTLPIKSFVALEQAIAPRPPGDKTIG